MENGTAVQNERWSKLGNLFSTSKSTDSPAISDGQKPSNPENRRQGETYVQWGTRICGIVTGRLTALSPYLQKVYYSIYNEQANNIKLQETARANTQAEIERINGNIHDINNQINGLNQDINDCNKDIDSLKIELQKIKSAKEEVNKEQRMKLIIGLFIIIPLTFYLFLFYSSTFYSAFFRDPSNMTSSVMNSMFDSNALANAYSDGIAELGFVLSAPIIFLGLGFSLHFFSVQKEKIKYLKMLAILVVTVMFDCILAYKIGDQMHALGIMVGQYPIGEEYTVSMAFHDINTWAVIFCGFIVYVIWGIVFDMCMSAYDKLDLNKTRQQGIRKEIDALNKKIKDAKGEIQTLRQQEINEKNNVNALMAKLGKQVYIDYAAIKTEMNNFFAGWIKMMQILSIGKELQNDAISIYNREISMLIPSQK